MKNFLHQLILVLAGLVFSLVAIAQGENTSTCYKRMSMSLQRPTTVSIPQKKASRTHDDRACYNFFAEKESEAEVFLGKTLKNLRVS